MNKVAIFADIKALQAQTEFILVPKEEYESLNRIKEKGIVEIQLTDKQNAAFRKSEEELKKGEYLTLDELSSQMARPRAKARR